MKIMDKKEASEVINKSFNKSMNKEHKIRAARKSILAARHSIIVPPLSRVIRLRYIE